MLGWRVHLRSFPSLSSSRPLFELSTNCDSLPLRSPLALALTPSECIHTLTGHTSTIRCIRVLDRSPIAVTGSRDSTLRVWDLQKGELKHVLRGHTGSIRCIDLAGNLCVSGSYDTSARVSAAGMCGLA